MGRHLTIRQGRLLQRASKKILTALRVRLIRSRRLLGRLQ